LLSQDGAGRTDGQLLESFVGHQDEAAFAALVRRHGPMVLGVCRRVLRHHHDAEDAFQATFLVLARKAASVEPRERVANWLHGVAYRTALKARAMKAKRQVRERQVVEMPEPEVAPQDSWHDLQPLLDQELRGLPETYRLPLLLCDLQRQSIKEATRQLGWPQGTVAGRLARGRKMLAQRLARRGLVLSAGSPAAVLSQNAVSAGVPTPLVSSTVKAASLVAAGQMAVAGVVPVKVAALLEGVLKAMLITRLKTVMAALLVVVAVGIGGGLLSRPTTTAAPPADEVLPNGGGGRPASQVRSGPLPLGAGVNSDAGPTGPVAVNERNLVTYGDGGAVDQQGEAVPQLARKEHDFLMRQLYRINQQQADKDLKIAEFYRRTGHLGAAYYYYEIVARSGDRTLAPRARARMADLKKRHGRRVDLEGEWMGRVKGVAVTLVFGPGDSVLLIRGDGQWDRGSYSVDFKKQPHHLTLHWTEPFGKFRNGTFRAIMQFEQGGLVRLEPAGEGEPRPKKFTAASVLLQKDFRLPSGEKGHPPVETEKAQPQPPPRVMDQPPPARRAPDGGAKKPGRVGMIFVVGNTKTATSVILKKIPLRPGEVLDYQALRTAEKNLAALNSTITVVEDGASADFQDILVRVKEK
jgi:RNA polymerase sigma factor (sigma-70 family)